MDCISGQQALATLGITPTLHSEKSPKNLDSPLKMARYAASLFVDADFSNLPTRGEVLAELRQNRHVVVTLLDDGKTPSFIVSQGTTLGYKNWVSMKRRIGLVGCLLTLK